VGNKNRFLDQKTKELLKAKSVSNKMTFLKISLEYCDYLLFEGALLNNRLYEPICQTSNFERVREEHFVNSLWHLCELLKELKANNELRQITNLASWNDISDVRDMRQHIIQYVKGKGNNQNDFIKPVAGIPTLLSNATQSITLMNCNVDGENVNDGCRIGGRILLNEALLNAIDNVKTDLLKHQESLLNLSQN
jgi:hypothetical protein